MRSRCLILILISVLLLSACSVNQANSKSTVNFYYIQNELQFGTDSGVIKPTTREMDAFENDYFQVITQYLNGPISYDCISPFPAGTTLEELHWDQNRVQIILSPHIATLSGVDLMVACACLTKTVTELTGISTIQVRSSSGLLNGEQSLTLTADSFLFLDQATPNDSLN